MSAVKLPRSCSCALRHTVGGCALARSRDAPSPPPPTARRRPPIPHRRRPRDHADLPPRARPALLRGLRRCSSDDGGREELRAYFAPYLTLAREHGVGFVLDTATLAREPRLGRAAGLRARRPRRREPGGGGAGRGDPRRGRGQRGRRSSSTACIGPRGDGYDPGELMSADEAQRYHARADRDVRRQRAPTWSPRVTMTTPEEAIGIARAARDHALPAVDLLHRRDRRAPARRPAR